MDGNNYSNNVEQVDTSAIDSTSSSTTIRSFSNIHTDVWRIILKSPLIFILLPAVVWFPFDLLTEYIAQSSTDNYFSNLRIYYRVQRILNLFVGSWVIAIEIEALRMIANNSELIFRKVISQGSKHYGRVFGTVFAFSWRVGLATIFFIIPGIVLAIRYALAIPVAIFEKQHGKSALTTSQEYMQGKGWRLLGYFISGIMLYLPGLFGVLFLLPQNDEPLMNAVYTIPFNIASVLILMFIAIFYIDASGNQEMLHFLKMTFQRERQIYHTGMASEPSHNKRHIFITLIISISLFIMGFYNLVTLPPFEGEKMIFGNEQHEIYYTKDIEQAEIKKLGAALIDLDYFNSEESEAVKLTNDKSNYNLYIFLAKEYWNDKDILENLESWERYLSEIGMSKPVNIIMIEDTFEGREERRVYSSFE